MIHQTFIHKISFSTIIMLAILQVSCSTTIKSYSQEAEGSSPVTSQLQTQAGVKSAHMKPSTQLSEILKKHIYDKKNCNNNPLIVAHRGASGSRPEHTLESYRLALDMGADYIEPDLVMTKDGYVVIRHENEISGTTNVAEIFPNRKATKVIDGETLTGYFTEDFTLAEIKRLKAKERLSFRNQEFNFKFEVPSFEEFLAFVRIEEKRRKKKIGIAPEIKHSTYFQNQNLAMEDKVIHLLKKYDFAEPDSLVMVQSFEVNNLKKMKEKLNISYVQLLESPDKAPADGSKKSYAEMVTVEGFKEIRTYADWVSPHKSYIAQTDVSGNLTKITPFVSMAHQASLKVVPYTFRSDGDYLAKAYLRSPELEYHLFYSLGVDALFTDFTEHAVQAKASWQRYCTTR